MDEFERYQTLIEKYESQIQRDPRSRVFAPLSEIYRKIGSLEKALEILKVGIRYNPDYVLGYLGLAACYKEMGQHQLNYVMLKPLIPSNKDNIRLLKYFAESAELTNNFQEALETYKFILFLNSKDSEAIAKVKSLESRQELSVAVINNEKFEEEKIASLPEKQNIDDWILFDIAKDNKKQNSPKKIEMQIKPELVVPKKTTEAVDATPVITHTLVDLYVRQGHLEKAVEILDKILLLNPDDQKTLAKKNEVLEILGETTRHSKEKRNLASLETEDEARKKLLELIDEKVKTVSSHDSSDLIESKLWEFHKKLVKRAQDGPSSY